MDLFTGQSTSAAVGLKFGSNILASLRGSRGCMKFRFHVRRGRKICQSTSAAVGSKFGSNMLASFEGSRGSMKFRFWLSMSVAISFLFVNRCDVREPWLMWRFRASKNFMSRRECPRS